MLNNRHYLTARALAAVAALLLLAGCAGSVHVPAGRVCDAGDFRVVDDFAGARRGSCRAGDGVATLEIRREDDRVTNPSPWFAFRLEPEVPTTAVVRLDYGTWEHRYVPKLSHDGLRWLPVDPARMTVSGDERYATIRLPLADAPVWVAAQELLLPPAYDIWTQGLATAPGVRRAELGRSRNGLPIHWLDAGTDKGDVVVLVGRQHPPEVSGAFAMFGFVDTVLGDSDLAQRFRERFRIVIVPLMNPDGVIGGNWRHGFGEKDLNRDWGPFTQPETRLVGDLLDAIDARGQRVRAFIDFHSTDRNLLYTQDDSAPTDPPGFTPEWLANAAARLPDYAFTNEAGPVSEQANSKNYMYKRYGIPAVTFEVGDETDRTLTRAAAIVFAEEFMRLLLRHYD